MSNFLGIPDFIPQVQPFNPDLNFYAGVLATKQQQYDLGLKRMGSIYGSVLNSPMSRQDNIQRRDKYFQTIEQDVQKIAGMDLSIDQNVNVAKTLFDPILNDGDIVKDMAYTKQTYNAFETGEQYRNCVDPAKCGGEYWDTGMQAIQLQLDDFKNATPEDARKMQAPKFVPAQNVTKQALAAAKAAGFNSSYEYLDGRYMVTDTNGYLLLDKQNKDGSTSKGVLPQYLYGAFGNNAAVQDMYATQAYVQRRMYAKQNAGNFAGGELEAEQEYLNKIIAETTPKLEKNKKDVLSLRDNVSTDIKALEAYNKNHPEDYVKDAYDRLQDIMNKTAATVDYHENVSNLINTAPNLNDISKLRSRADSIVANAAFQRDIDGAAYQYAMGTAKREIKADPYSLAAYNNALDLNKAKQLKIMDQEMWFDRQAALGNLGGKKSGGITWEDATRKITPDRLHNMGIDEINIKRPENQTKLITAGYFEGDKADVTAPFVTSGTENIRDTHIRNMEITSRATDNAEVATTDFLKTYVSNMREAYQKAKDSPNSKDAQIIMDKIVADANQMFKGSGMNVSTMLFGDKSELSKLDSNPKLSEASAFALESLKNDSAAKIYNSGWDNTSAIKMQIANATAKKLLGARESAMKGAVNEVIADVAKVNEGNPEAFEIEAGKYASLIGPGGTLLNKEEALKQYARTVVPKYNADHPSAAVMEFAKEYDDYYKRFVGKMKALDSRAGEQDTGGAVGVANSITKVIKGKDVFSTNYMVFQDLAKEIRRNPNNLPVSILSGSDKDIRSLKSTPETVSFANKIFDKIISDDARDMGITTETLLSPGNNTVLVKTTVNNDEIVRKLKGLKSTDPVSDDMRSFVTVLPQGFNYADDFMRKTELKSPDILLQNNGESLSVAFPGKGSGTIENKNGMWGGSYTALVPDDTDPSGKLIEISGKLPNLPNTNAEKTLLAMSEVVGNIVTGYQKKRLIQIEKQKADARLQQK